MPRILLTHSPEAFANYYGERALAKLSQSGEVIRTHAAEPLAGPSLIEAAKDCDIIVSYRQSPGEAAIFEALPNLVAFVRCAVDIRNVDVEAASRHGVLVTQASPGFAASVAEMAIGFMIDLGRHVPSYVEAYHRGTVPEARMGVQLQGSTIGVIGYGTIGRHLCRLALAFGMRVLVDDPHVTIDDPGIVQVDKMTLLQEADFVVCLAVATEATENLMNETAFAAMKRTGYFINLSRGGLVDEAALARALDARRIAGAAMDVGRAPDQMPSPLLAHRPDVLATPHSAGLTVPSIEHQSMETAAQVAEIVHGRAPKGAVNADRASRLARFS